MGSVRMLYEMQNGEFPYKLNDEGLGPHPIQPYHLAEFLEISQIGLTQDDTVYVHSDPRSRGNPQVNDAVRYHKNVRVK